MKTSKSTKLSVLTTAICLILCASMLLGNTYAWFSDSVNNEKNVIAAGTLDVVMEYSNDGKNWTDASTGKIFDYTLWEPGYTDVKYIKIKNAGTLAFNFALTLEADEVATNGAKLSEVIDVYMGVGASNRNDVTNMTCVGTLADLMADADGAAYGQLLAGQELDQCIVLKMQESAGNEYQNLSIGDGVAVKLVATQLTHEEDSFGPDYDENSGKPVAAIYRQPQYENTDIPWGSYGSWSPTNADQHMEAAYTFSATDDATTVMESPYKDWICDYYVSVDTDVEAGKLFLGGYYESFNVWVGFENPIAVTANTQVPLLGSVGGAPWTYEMIVKNVGKFVCGVADIDNALTGATVNVELRLTNPNDATDFFTVNETAYTFKHEVFTADELANALSNGKSVVLAQNVDLPSNTKITVPKGVVSALDLNGHTLSMTDSGTGNREMFLVMGNLTVSNGNVEMAVTNNQGWNAMSTIFDITAGGVLNLNDVVAVNQGGTDMNFVVHMNNWGEVTLNVKDSVLSATYVAVRVFNSGYDMNNVTIENSTLTAPRCFWVHNYTAADFGSSYDKAVVEGRLNFNIFGNGNTFNYDTAAYAGPVRYGMTDSIYLDANGNEITNP